MLVQSKKKINLVLLLEFCLLLCFCFLYLDFAFIFSSVFAYQFIIYSAFRFQVPLINFAFCVSFRVFPRFTSIFCRSPALFLLPSVRTLPQLFAILPLINPISCLVSFSSPSVDEPVYAHCDSPFPPIPTSVFLPLFSCDSSCISTIFS